MLGESIVGWDFVVRWQEPRIPATPVPQSADGVRQPWPSWRRTKVNWDVSESWSGERSSNPRFAGQRCERGTDIFPGVAGVHRRLVMFGLNHTELLIFLGIALLLFGGSRIPNIARSLGKSITEFKKGMQGIEDEINNPSDDAPKKVDA